MNLTSVLKKAWHVVWHYRALWLFGAILALVAANPFIPGLYDWDDNEEWTKIKVTDNFTIRAPFGEMTIDLTATEGVRITVQDGVTWREFQDIVDEVERDASINLWAILIELAVIAFLLILFGTIIRYITETAVIRMVNESEETGRQMNVWQGLRSGWSARAGRLFVVDLVARILTGGLFVVLFGLAVAPILLSAGSSEALRTTAGIATAGLLIIATISMFIAAAGVSLVMQPIRQAVILEGSDLPSSARQGFAITRNQPKDVGLLWLIWFGIRLVWVPVAAVVAVLLAPVLLGTILAGTVLGSVPAILVGAVASLFIGGATPWIIGMLAGLPVFVVVTISPLLFVGGFVKIYLSSIWTLGYRELKAVKHPIQAHKPQATRLADKGAAD